MKPKIALYDIETAPLKSYTWGLYEQNVIKVIQDWHILCFSIKWLGERKVYTYSLPGYKDQYRKNKIDDHLVCKELHRWFDEADVLIGHNSDKFDTPKANARFITHGMLPPSTYRSVDTLKVARKQFAFTSNKLGDLAERLGVGSKLQTGGFSLWEGCMAGDEDAWKRMRKYSAQDVILLEQVYLKLRPWADNHVNLSLYNGNRGGCPTCQSTSVQKRGFVHTQTYTKQRFVCTDCGHWFSGGVLKK